MTNKTVLIKELIKHDIPESTQALETFVSSCLDAILAVAKNNPRPNDIRLVQTALDELAQSYLLFKDHKHVRKVSIFGSARTQPSHPNYTLAESTAKTLVQKGFLVITGAGPGIMEAGNKGAFTDSYGLHILLPFEQAPNIYIAKEKTLAYRYFFTRKLTFVKESDAIVLFPGGFGTQDEGFEVLTLMQTGRCSPRPFIVINYDKSSYWETWMAYIKKELLDRHYISPEDIDLIKQLSSPDEIAHEIAHFYSTYHSIKYYENRACMRLNYPISAATLDNLNRLFESLLTPNSGVFALKDASFIQEDSSYFPEKPRLIFPFNHQSYGGLIKLIHYINDETKKRGGSDTC